MYLISKKTSSKNIGWLSASSPLYCLSLASLPSLYLVSVYCLSFPSLPFLYQFGILRKKEQFDDRSNALTRYNILMSLLTSRTKWTATNSFLRDPCIAYDDYGDQRGGFTLKVSLNRIAIDG